MVRSMRQLSARDNPQVKLLRGVAHSARERRKHGLTVLDGIHLLEAALADGAALQAVFVSDDALKDAEVCALLDRVGEVPIVHLLGGLFAHVCPVETPTGVLTLMPVPVCTESIVSDKTVLLLDTVQDPGNLGSLLRTAAAAGIVDVFLSRGCTHAWSPKALRAGMGAQFSLRIREDLDLLECLRQYTEPVIATSLKQDSVELFDLDLARPCAWLFGAEGQGVSEALLARANVTARIPMPGCTESLNVAAAAAICLFEQVRQRRREPSGLRAPRIC